MTEPAENLLQQGPSRVPFPVTSPYEVKSDLMKLEQDFFSSQPIIRDELSGQYRAAKLALLRQPTLQAEQGFSNWNQPRLITYQSLIRQLETAAFVHSLQGDQQVLGPGTEPSSLAPSAESVCRWWRKFGESLQEDWVVMQQTGEGFVPDLMQVCFPSGWSPAEKYQMDLKLIHAPVADSERLRLATRGIASAMVSKGPFVRYVWSLALAGQLSQFPGFKRNTTPGERIDIKTIWFRCERQVTIPFPEQACSLFLIRVFVAPLMEVLNQTGVPKDQTAPMPQRLWDALASMSKATLAYKGITDLQRNCLAQLPQYFAINTTR